tara:strand:- start:1443 stop:2225 length:783 start_codon:yes stop_codon:yes gene_type:complete
MDLLFKNFSTGYESNLIISDLNLKIKSGEWIGIIGANGCGKSTLLKGISKIIPIQNGDVLFNSSNIKVLSTKEIAKIVSYLPQKINPNLPITVKELVSLGRSPHKYFWEFDLNKNDLSIIDEALELCDLKKYSNNPLSSLSGGQCQRAYLALTIAQKTKILLLDEPTTFLDINFQLQMLDLIKTLNKKNNLTILSVIHDVNLAARYCDRLAVFKQGELIAIDEPIKALSKEIIKKAFSVESSNVDTPVGKQICALKPINN